MLYTYDWYDFSLRFGEQTLAIRAAEKFSTDDKARGRTTLPFGSSLWPAALVLSDVLAARPEVVQGKSVLELGCGLGLCSLLAARLGARSVLATDGHPDMSALFRHNAECNGCDIPYTPFDWQAEKGPGQHEMVLASDVLYEPSACNLLAHAFERTLAPGGLGVVCDPGRPHARRFVEKMQNRGFTVEETRHAVPSDMLMDETLQRVLAMHPTSKRQHYLYWLRHS